MVPDGITSLPGGLACAAAFVTPLGGFACRFENRSGSLIKKGTGCGPSLSNDSAVIPCNIEYDTLGFAYEDIPNGGSGFVVVAGIGQALLKDGTAGTRGYFTKASATAGRVEAVSVPTGGGIPATEVHFKEIGHCLETVSAGTDVLVKVLIHPL